MLNQKAKPKNSIMVGDSVIIANRFFNNHGMTIKSVGTGHVINIEHTPTEFMEIDFRFHPILLACARNGYIFSCRQFKENDIFVARIKIHPVYIDKIKEKRK